MSLAVLLETVAPSARKAAVDGAADERHKGSASGANDAFEGTAQLIRHQLRRLPDNPLCVGDIANALQALVSAGLDRLPLPGRGQSIERWSALAEVSSWSLSLAKLFEGHCDALAICAEFGIGATGDSGLWGVFAAETNPPELRAHMSGAGRVTLHGRKQWCSGVEVLDRALVTVHTASDERLLVAVGLADRGVRRAVDGWAAQGMRHTGTETLEFHGTPGVIVGPPGSYISRPGFWHGALGVAACWYGGATTLARTLQRALAARADDFHLMHLGAVAFEVHAMRAALTAAARQIDHVPDQDVQALALAVRAQVEASCEHILQHVGRAMGATPFCRDPAFALMAADLPVFLRQSHAERDLKALGRLVRQREDAWTDLATSL